MYSGALGKKTKFQSTNLAQLLLKVEKESELASGAVQAPKQTDKPVVGLPKVSVTKSQSRFTGLLIYAGG